MEIVNQKEYLKKYLAIGKAPGEKKKKKKSKNAANRVKIIDDDAETFTNNIIEEDPLQANEDAPQIVAIIDERPPSMRVDDKTKNPLWQPIGTSDLVNSAEQKQMITGFKIAPKSNDKIFARPPDRSPPRRKKTVDNLANHEYSPPRKKTVSDDHSPSRKKTMSDDHSPPRKKTMIDDHSPPRKSKNIEHSQTQKSRTNDDNSPPKRKSSMEDNSPPRRSRTEDNSPPRRSRTEDNSPPRKTKRTDSSPPRRPKSRDISPPRKNRQSKDTSPPRRHKYRPSDRSPSRKHDRKKDEAKEEQRLHSSKEKASNKIEKTLEGKKAGLQDAKQLADETKQFRSREDQLFKNLPKEVSGENAETVFRDRKSGKIRNLEEEEERQQRKREEEEKNKEKYSRWGRGLVQVENRDQKIQEELYEMSKPLARYADDEDLEKFLKEQEREGDPMLAYIRSKRRKEAAKAGIVEKPQFEGQFMPNRYGIKPGHRWDGVDRSNGYEKRWFEVQNAKRAQQEDSYKWSTEDM